MNNSWKSTAAGAGLILLLTAVTYFPALRNGFIWDDDDHLTANPAVASVSGLKQIWSSLRVSRYYPLTLTSFWAQRRLWGLNPLPYHAVNVSLQAANAVLLWLLLRRLRVPAAWVAAAVWAVHPVTVETVAWVTELKNTQSALFFFLALLAFTRFDDKPRPRNYGLTLAYGAAAMLSKPSTVVLPVVMLLCIWWRRRACRLKDFLYVAPFVAFALGMSLLTVTEQQYHITTTGASEWKLTVAQRLILASRALWFYAGKVLCPVGLSFIYPHWDLSPDSLAAWLPLAGLTLAAGMLWYFHRDGWARAAIFGGGFFVVALLPVLGLFDIFFFRYSYVADHFQYLACIGLIALAVSAGSVICQRFGERGRDLGVLLTGVILLVLAASSRSQIPAYSDSESLWRHTVAENPGAWIAHNNLGVILRDTGRAAEAIPHHRQVLQLKPDSVEAHNDLGNALLDLGAVTEAIQHFEQALRMDPANSLTHYDLGGALRQAGRLNEAIAQYEEALRLRKDYPEAHNNLGDVLLQLGKANEAIPHLEQALQLKPDSAETYYNLGRAYALRRETPLAINHFEHALQLKPQYAEAHYNLGVMLALQGETNRAAECYRRALDLAVEQGNTALIRAARAKIAIASP